MAETRLTLGAARQLAVELAAVKQLAARMERELGQVKTTLAALERRLGRVELPR